MTTTQALDVAIEALADQLHRLASWGPRSPKSLRQSSWARDEFRRVNDARRVLRNLRGEATR